MTYANSTAACPFCEPWEGQGSDGFLTGSEWVSADGATVEDVDEPVQNTRIVLFYDGTQNNKYNVELRQRLNDIEKLARQLGIKVDNTLFGFDYGRSKKSVDDYKDKISSYTNGLSNVARLFNGFVDSSFFEGDPYDKVYPIYVEGIGSNFKELDDTFSGKRGSGLGTGERGVIARVWTGIHDAINEMWSAPPKSPDIPFEYIHFDVFGFSRGAAAARNAVYQIKNGWEYDLDEFPGVSAVHGPVTGAYGFRNKTVLPFLQQMTGNDYTVDSLEIRFAGLFDTVASYGLNHDHDTDELKLDCLSNVNKTIHLTAADEHRKNFRLTDIKSAGLKGSEIFLPGVHADIGGSYPVSENASLTLWEATASSAYLEEKQKIQSEEENWFRQRGWFSGSNSTIDATNELKAGYDAIYYELKLVATRTIPDDYTYIPLNLMRLFCEDQELQFTNVKLVAPHLQGIFSKVREYAIQVDKASSGSPPYRRPGNGYSPSSVDDWYDKTEAKGIDLKSLRSNYLHISANYDGKVFGVPPMEPEYSEGKRRRVVQVG